MTELERSPELNWPVRWVGEDSIDEVEFKEDAVILYINRNKIFRQIIGLNIADPPTPPDLEAQAVKKCGGIRKLNTAWKDIRAAVDDAKTETDALLAAKPYTSMDSYRVVAGALPVPLLRSL